MHNQKSTAVALLVLLSVDSATKGTGLFLHRTACDEEKTSACRLIKGVAFLVNFHMLDVLTAPRGDIAIGEAKKNGTT